MYHINPSWSGPGVSKIDCLFADVFDNGLSCVVEFLDGARVSVDLRKVPYYVTAHRVKPEPGPICDADYKCQAPGQITVYAWDCGEGVQE